MSFKKTPFLELLETPALLTHKRTKFQPKFEKICADSCADKCTQTTVSWEFFALPLGLNLYDFWSSGQATHSTSMQIFKFAKQRLA